jgi:hydroxypyruvate reductase/glycerate 2-kinase
VTASPSPDRDQARAIWQAAVAAARPYDLIRLALADPALGLRPLVQSAQRIIVVGAGKASGAMSAALEDTLGSDLGRLGGLVNVPDTCVLPLRRIQLHAARPAASNEPTAAGVAGARRILDLVGSAGPDDLVLCLLSGGGSALLPLPVSGVTLEDKQKVTGLLHACGATINEMNAVRKHLSGIKGGRLAEHFRGRALVGLIISDVIGDPLDVIASGPTAPDPTTFGDALAVFDKYQLSMRVPPAVLAYLRQGAAGRLPETPKTLPASVANHIIGNNVKSLAAARARAEEMGYRVLNLGSYIEGETQSVGVAMAGIVGDVREQGQPVAPPVCVLSGGETTVTLTPDHGLGGRNQEFVLAVTAKLGREGMENVVVLSGGTDGEDGPTDAAGAVADRDTLPKAAALGLGPAGFLARHDAYHFFEATGDLLKTGLTQTNVMDVRVIMVGR